MHQIKISHQPNKSHPSSPMKLLTLPLPHPCSSNPTLLRFRFKPQSSLQYPNLTPPKSQSKTTPKPRVLIIGAGLAGLAAATHLNSQNIPFLLLEASDDVGGRVRTDVVDGFLLDRGFQIFITAYPEAQKLLDYQALDLQRFYSGARIYCDGQFHTVADPLRNFWDSIKSLTNPIGSISDKFLIGLTRLRVLTRSDEEIFASDMHFPMTISPIQMLHGSNFKKWKSDIELNLGILDFDHVLTEDPPAALPANPTRERKEAYERWYKHNKMALICIKKSMTDNVKGGVPDSNLAKTFFNAIAEKYKTSDKAETGALMNKLIKMQYTGKGNVREYIMKGSDIAGKLRDLNISVEEPFLVHMILNSLPEQFGHLKTLYKTQKEKWSINELISLCVEQEDEINKQGKDASVNLMSNQPFKKRFGNSKFHKGSSSNSKTAVKHDNNKSGKSNDIKKCFFCKKTGHFKKECEGFKAWLEKKGIIKSNNPN